MKAWEALRLATKNEPSVKIVYKLTERLVGVIGCEPYAINVQARDDPAKLGFPVCVTGTRVRIPRRAFLHWMEFGNAPVKGASA